MHCGAQRVDVLCRGYSHEVDLRALPLAEPAHHIQPTHVRQVDVEQDEIRAQRLHRGERIHSRVRFADDRETRDAFDERAMDARDHEVVVDD